MYRENSVIRSIKQSGKKEGLQVSVTQYFLPPIQKRIVAIFKAWGTCGRIN